MIDRADRVMLTTGGIVSVLAAYAFGALTAGWNPLGQAKATPAPQSITTTDPLAAFALAIETCDRGHGLQPFEVSVARDAITCHYAPVNLNAVPVPQRKTFVGGATAP